MDTVDIKLNTGRGNNTTIYTVNSFDKLDKVLATTNIPKLFYRYKASEKGIFVVVPEEYEDVIREILSHTLFIDLIGFENYVKECKRIENEKGE